MEHSIDTLDKAAKMLKIKLPVSSLLSDVSGYKYGAYSFESWGEIWQIMQVLKITKSNKPYYDNIRNYDKISAFNDLLKSSGLIHIEW